MEIAQPIPERDLDSRISEAIILLITFGLWESTELVKVTGECITEIVRRTED